MKAVSKLTEKQRQTLKKYGVFTAMFVLTAGFIFLIYSPSQADADKEKQQSGFNADIPNPDDVGIIADKKDAYEQEQMKQKQAERMRSLEDYASLTESNPIAERSEGKETKPESSKPIERSSEAYRNIQQSLNGFYEQPRADPEKEELKRRLDEMEARLKEREQKQPGTEEQLALMEKSYQLAAKYMPVEKEKTVGAEEMKNKIVKSGGKSKLHSVPVRQATQQTVSALPQPLSDEALFNWYDQPRNETFYTAIAETSDKGKNTILAVVHAGQSITDGQNIRLRLAEPMLAGKMLIPENTVLSGNAKIQGERLQITIHSLEYNGSIIHVVLQAYDTDGQKGIFIPGTKEINAVKEAAANMGTTAGTSISLSSDAGEQFAADMGRSVIQGVSQFFSKKMREVKVNLKAGYRVLLLPGNQSVTNQ